MSTCICIKFSDNGPIEKHCPVEHVYFFVFKTENKLSYLLEN